MCVFFTRVPVAACALCGGRGGAGKYVGARLLPPRLLQVVGEGGGWRRRCLGRGTTPTSSDGACCRVLRAAASPTARRQKVVPAVLHLCSHWFAVGGLWLRLWFNMPFFSYAKCLKLSSIAFLFFFFYCHGLFCLQKFQQLLEGKKHNFILKEKVFPDSYSLAVNVHFFAFQRFFFWD